MNEQVVVGSTRCPASYTAPRWSSHVRRANRCSVASKSVEYSNVEPTLLVVASGSLSGVDMAAEYEGRCVQGLECVRYRGVGARPLGQ